MTKRLAGRTVSRTVSSTDDGTVERTDEQEPSLREAESYEHMERIRSELGDDEGYVLLSRRMQNGQLATLAKINASIFDVDYIIKKFGGGTYSARFYKSGVAIDDGGFLGSVPFIIDPSVQPEPEPAPTALAPAGSGEGTLVVLVQQMLSEFKELRKVPVATAPAPVDPMAMIKAIGETMKVLAPAPVAAPVSMGLKDQIDMIKSVIEVGTTVLDARGGGGSDTGDAMVDMVSKLADPVIDLVKIQAGREAERRQPARNPVTRPRLVPTPATAAAALPNPPAPPTEAPVPITWVQEIQKWVPLIVKRAQRARSAEDTAFFVLDELSDVTLKKLAEIAALPDFASRAAGILPPELGEYPEWTTEFLAAVQDYLFGEDDDGDINSALDALPPVEPEGSDPDPVAVDVTPEKEPVPTS